MSLNDVFLRKLFGFRNFQPEEESPSVQSPAELFWPWIIAYTLAAKRYSLIRHEPRGNSKQTGKLKQAAKRNRCSEMWSKKSAGIFLAMQQIKIFVQQ